jgi:NhaA family Na+:H+ antiporter
MATDIAFALGVLALLGSRVPVGLRIFLTALAIVDDLMAVLVIAIFYTYDLHVDMLVAAAGVFVVLLLANRAGVRHPIVTRPGHPALVLRLSGVHATIAGVRRSPSRACASTRRPRGQGACHRGPLRADRDPRPARGRGGRP